VPTSTVFEAESAGDPVATSVIDDAVQYWGMAVANLVSLFNPEMIIMGGGVFESAARLIPRVRDEARRWAQPISINEVSIETSLLGSDAGLYGAARLALAEHAVDRGHELEAASGCIVVDNRNATCAQTSERTGACAASVQCHLGRARARGAIPGRLVNTALRHTGPRVSSWLPGARLAAPWPREIVATASEPQLLEK